jgi:ATP-binding cassette subfamily B (MDR/TAP) protein 1
VYSSDAVPSLTDEATSALDVISRVLVFEAIKERQKNKTTILITHDLSQITSKDFTYVLKSGFIFEQGYREDLEMLPEGEFRRLLVAQSEAGGFPEKVVDDESSMTKYLFIPSLKAYQIARHSWQERTRLR